MAILNDETRRPPTVTPATLAFLRLEQLLSASGVRTRSHLRPITFILTDTHDSGADSKSPHSESVWSFDPRRPADMIAPIEHERPAGVLFVTSRVLHRLVFSRSFEPDIAEGDPIRFQGDVAALIDFFDSLQVPTNLITARIAGPSR